MKRRALFAAGATGLALAVTGGIALAADSTAAPATSETWPVGNFVVGRKDKQLFVAASSDPSRLLWETAVDGNFLTPEIADMTAKSFGFPQGSFDITDKVKISYGKPTIDDIAGGGDVIVRGTVQDSKGAKIGYAIRFYPASDTQLAFEVTTDRSDVNRIGLRLASVPEEAIFGFGMQMTYFDQKGHLLPIVVQEHGVGRGSPVVTQIVNTLASQGGGTPYSTEAPVPQFITSRLRSMFLENTEYSEFDMRSADAIEIKLWAAKMRGRIVFGATPIDIIESYSEYSGRMRVLPDWVHEGAIVSVQGGTDKVRAKLDELNAAGIPVAALWIQDWPGIRITSVGSQLWWNWQLDQTFYPGWDKLVADLRAQGARMLTYINPFLSHEDGHNSMFLEAKAKGYLVRSQDGSPFLNKNTNFTAALIDLSNPDARAWIKGIMRINMIEAAGSSGWMNDFGEAMPFDGAIAGGDAAAFHNQYPVEWARVAREAAEEAGLGDDVLFWDRSGYTQSPGHATAFWLGDQLQSWDEYDGLKSSLVGTLSSGISGYSLVHSDVGGYNALSFKVAGKKIPVITRDPELLMRWMELNAFTAIFRTHEGLDPAISAQFDTNAQTKAQLKRFSLVYKALAPYRKSVVAEAAGKGTPVVRPLFLHYPSDENTYGLRFQFMLGRDVLVAPVVEQGATSVEVYFPQGESWTNLWTGDEIGTAGDWVRIDAPMGQPGVFLRKGGEASASIRSAFAGAGLL